MLKTVRYIITYLDHLNIAYFRKYKAFFYKSHRKYITQINNALFKKRAIKARFPLLYYTLLNRVTPIYMVKIIKKTAGRGSPLSEFTPPVQMHSLRHKYYTL